MVYLITCLIVTVGFNFVQCRDLINFNVYQTGNRIHGHYKLPANNVKINFELNEVNSSHTTFNVASISPHPFDLSGDIIVEINPAIASIKGQASSNSASAKVSFESKISPLANGAKLEINFNINVSDIIVKYQFGLERVSNCWPFHLRHNLTTEPAELVNFTSNVTGYCDGTNRPINDVTLNGFLRSTKWPQLNSTILQRWSFNSSGGNEEMTFDNPSIGSMLVTNDWINSSHPITNKTALFTSRNKYLPSFHLRYSVDGEKRSFIFVPVDKNGYSNN